jgi:hypothetical protein
MDRSFPLAPPARLELTTLRLGEFGKISKTAIKSFYRPVIKEKSVELSVQKFSQYFPISAFSPGFFCSISKFLASHSFPRPSPLLKMIKNLQRLLMISGAAVSFWRKKHEMSEEI